MTPNMSVRGRGSAPGHQGGARRHARRRGGRRNGQDDRAGQPHPPGAGDRPREDGRDRRRDVHGKGSRRAQVAPARDARTRARVGRGARAGRRGDSASPRTCARDARGGARQYHPWILRRSAPRAARRSARGSAVQRADRAAVRSVVCPRLPCLAPRGARGSAGRAPARASPYERAFVRRRCRRGSDRSASPGRTHAGRVARFPGALAPAAIRPNRRDRPPRCEPPSPRGHDARAGVAARQPFHRYRGRAPAERPDRAGAVVWSAR